MSDELQELVRIKRDYAELVASVQRLGIRNLVAGWNGENQKDGPYDHHPSDLGVNLKTNCGIIYAIDDALRKAKTQ